MSSGATAFERALDQLGRAIVSGQVPAGHVDTIEGLVERTGASRSVVREASRVLGSLGLLSAGRRVGLRVLGAEHWDVLDPLVIRWRLEGPDPQVQIAELRALRLAIEPAAASAAAQAVAGWRAAGPAADRTGRVPEALRALQDAAEELGRVADDPDPAAFLRADRDFHAAALALSGNTMFARLRRVIDEHLRDRALRERAGLPPEPHDLELHRTVARAIADGSPVVAASAMSEILDRTGPSGTDSLRPGRISTVVWTRGTSSARAMVPREHMTTAVVIEDDDDIRRLLEVVLTQSGYTVTGAATGADGLAAIAAAPPTLALVDVGLPDMEGYEVVRRARPQVAGHIVMLSARSEAADARRGLEAGADEYLTKPFRPRVLREQLEEILSRPARAAEG
jgi:DNA-binding FadR family transcriptional regulator/CheY-like chemotaxis protein